MTGLLLIGFFGEIAAFFLGGMTRMERKKKIETKL
jgi:hypothetical protein